MSLRSRTLRRYFGASAGPLGGLVATLAVAGCSSQSLDLAVHDATVDSPGLFSDAGGLVPNDAPSDVDNDLGTGPSYEAIGIDPSHGPFVGGTRIVIRGHGFSSGTNVRFGAIDADISTIAVSDSAHVQVDTPPGTVGAVDVTVTDTTSGAQSTLAGGFIYDAFYAAPSTGATSGGTHVTLIGDETGWSAGTTATIDGLSCADLVVIDGTHLHCTTPADNPGVKPISVTTPDGAVTTVLDAFTYADTTDGYRGGLAGALLPGELDVLAIDNGTDELVEGATVVVRGADGTEQRGLTSLTGVAVFASPPPTPLTVTVTKKCLQPTTFDGVLVASVTAYLDDVLSVACIPPDGTPPVGGGAGSTPSTTNGTLVFPGGIEFQRPGFTGVPAPTRATQRLAAYVFVAEPYGIQPFALPDPTTAVTITSPGEVGYNFTLAVEPGNLTLYAIAGLEDQPETGQRTFDPYVYGLVRGVGVSPTETLDGVLIPMTGSFSHEVQLQPVAPPSSPTGPDRLMTDVSIDLGGTFMLLPNTARTDLLPVAGVLNFEAIPALDGALTTASYAIDMSDVTGGAGGLPTSAINQLETRDSSDAVPVGPFVPIPVLTSPNVGTPWDGQTVTFTLPPSSADVIVLSIQTSDGASGWTIVTSGDTRSIALPDFSASPELGLPTGPFNATLSAANIDDFDYDNVRYGQLDQYGWNSYATSVSYGSH